MTRLLEVDGIHTYYGDSQALFGMAFTVDEGEFVTLIGRNGMGKTTTVRSVMGILAPRRGSITFMGRPIAGQPSFRVAKVGLGLVPEGRQIFPNLTVRENLVATAAMRTRPKSPWTLQRVYQMFPRLQERERNLGNTLSGGEQQMLAIGRALMTNPRLLILDEATEGLAPLIRTEIWRCLEALKGEGQSLVVIDKNIGPLLQLADRHYIMEKGQVAWSGGSDVLRQSPDILREYVGV